MAISRKTSFLTLIGCLLGFTVFAVCLTAGALPTHALSPVGATGLRGRLAGEEIGLARATDPVIMALARRLDGDRRPDLAGRAEGWAILDFHDAPSLGLGAMSPEEAEKINAWLPTTGDAPPAASPFMLRAAGAERERALLCLTQAIYYEAALEPTPGQEAVAQSVLNRVRNPGFPKSICGVVYQGASQPGCQFSFACDGSRDRPPVRAFWNRARQVAEQAVDGFVMTAVGTATHYHADYVFPRWGPTLVKIRQIGAHIFYRFPGPAGQPASFRAPYGGAELRVSMVGPSPAAILAARAAAGGPAPETFAMVDPSAPNGEGARVAGQIVFGRRLPTQDEITRINASLAKMETAPSAGAGN